MTLLLLPPIAMLEKYVILTIYVIQCDFMLVHRLRSWPNIIQHWVNVNPENMRHSPDSEVMLAHRLRRLPNITPSLGERLMSGNGASYQDYTAGVYWRRLVGSSQLIHPYKQLIVIPY